MVKGIIFDLDGTLLDTLPDIHRVLNGSLAAFGLPAVSMEDTKIMVGNGARKLVERAVGGDNSGIAERVYRHYSENFARCDNALTKLFVGEERTLASFTAKGIKLAVVTNKPQRATENVCARHLSRFCFSHIIGQSADFPLKPDPAAVLHIAGEWGIDKEELLFVGDGETDVETAANAGIKCVSALWGYRSRSRLESAGAELFAENYGQLEIIVSNL